MTINEEKVSLFSLFFTFAKVGLFTFGGGYAMLPLLESECVDKKKWITKESLLDMFAVGQITPGIIAVNTATYVGYKKRGIAGSISATCGMVFPSLVIILLIATILQNFNENTYVLKAFKGIRIAVCGLMTSSLLKLSQKAIKSVSLLIISICALTIEIAFGISPIFLVLFILLYSFLIFKFQNRRTEK